MRLVGRNTIHILGVCAALACSELPMAAQNGRPTVSDSGANLPAQKLSSNDLISVFVYDEPGLSRTARVSADGYIRLPMLKERIKVQGLLPGDIEIAIANALRAEEILADPVVTVTAAEYTSRPISVVGA